MKYLNEKDLDMIGIPWSRIIDVIESATHCLEKDDFAQPVKPYLRYRDRKNRIIAMPAFIGGDFDMAGIKWIASFPGNIERGIDRAHSVIILNEADTGVPLSVINTALLSIIRTAGVSGLVAKYYDRVRPFDNAVVGISGWGPIGQYHARMMLESFGSRISKVLVYDVRNIDTQIDVPGQEKIVKAGSWQEAYNDADVFITCTVSTKPYIDRPPKPSSLHLNVSLRDYCTGVLDHVREGVIVDDWDEVCRENTDIENMHKDKGLQREGVFDIKDVVSGCIAGIPAESPIMFNPMGMATFDIAVASYYFEQARRDGLGIELN